MAAKFRKKAPKIQKQRKSFEGDALKDESDSDFSGLSSDEGGDDQGSKQVMENLQKQARGRVDSVAARFQSLSSTPEFDLEGQAIRRKPRKKDGTEYTEEEVQKRIQDAKVRQENRLKNLKLKEEKNRRRVEQEGSIKAKSEKKDKAQKEQDEKVQAKQKKDAKEQRKEKYNKLKQQAKETKAARAAGAVAGGAEGGEGVEGVEGAEGAEGAEPIKVKRRRLKYPNRGVIYLSHIPYGFFEEQMKTFFTQFGTITRIKLARNEFGKSQHHAFIEFEEKEVAPIVAEAMNDYIMFGRVLKCSVVPPEEVRAGLFKGSIHFKSKSQLQEEAAEDHNRARTKEQRTKREKRLLEKEDKFVKKLKKLGVDYSFDGYRASKPAQPKRVVIADED